MGKVFKLHTINGDGTEAEDRLIPFEVIDPGTSKPFRGEGGEPSVVIQLKPISQAKYREICADNTERLLNKKSRAMEEVTDWDAVQDDLIPFTIQSWTGIVGADDKPLQCVLDAKLGLPGDLKNELIQRALQGEAVDQTAAAFRSAS